VADGKREHMVPFAESFIRKLDVVAKKIEMELPEGLLELDAPLSSDEKKQQHQK
jgi:16S rRNA processing protein RimM